MNYWKHDSAIVDEGAVIGEGTKFGTSAMSASEPSLEVIAPWGRTFM
jgi:hypothetical protein